MVQYVLRLNGRPIHIFSELEEAIEVAERYPVQDHDLLYISADKSETVWEKGDQKDA